MAITPLRPEDREPFQNGLDAWVDRRALDRSGELVGVVTDVYCDPDTRRVRWFAIATGFFGARIAVVPVRGASLLGDDVVVAHSRHTIESAPVVDIVVQVEPRQQQLLIDHYSQQTPAASAGTPGKGYQT